MIAEMLKKLGHSLDGLVDTWRTERPFRQWLAVVAVSDIAALAIAPSAVFSAAIIALGFLQLAAELANTAIEAVVDKASPEQHPLAKKAKDAGSAMTLVTFAALLTLWAGVLLQAI